MFLKKSTIVICSTNNLSPVCLPPAIAPPSGRRHAVHQRGQIAAQWRPHGRKYATVHHESGEWRPGGHPKESPGLHKWPVSSHPTPYEIFGQQKGTPYSKKVFYELVKIYHPDRRHHSHASHAGLPRSVRLERYRLIVTANNILSDPVKRRAYDLYGAGWDGRSDMQNSFRTAEGSWRQEPDNPSMNATWEDWERWYQKREGKTQEPTYTSNGGFAVGVLICIMLGGWGQAVRAGKTSMDIIALRDEKNGMISTEMRRREEASAGLTREGRVESFLRQRDGLVLDRCSTEPPPPNGAKAK